MWTVAALCGVALTLLLCSVQQAHAGLLPGQPTFCLVNTATNEMTVGLDYARSGSCFLGLEEVYRGAIGRDLIAGVTQWALGLNLDVRALARITDFFGITGRDNGTVEIRTQNGNGGSEGTVRRSFHMKASRNRIFVGFGMQW
jgi:hypothetical protein